VDRSKASSVELTEHDVSNSLLISLSSSGQVAPNQWLNYVNGVNYQVAVQTPQYRIDSFDSLMRTPITATPGSGTSSGGSQPGNNSTSAGSSSNGVASQTNYSVGASPSPSGANYGNPGAASSPTQLLYNLAGLQRGTSTEIVNHYDVQPVFDVYANADKRDLGGIRSDVLKVMKSMKSQLPQATTLELRGQVETMQSSFDRHYICDHVGLFAHGRQFSKLAGSLHHLDGVTGCSGRRFMDALCHTNIAERSEPGGRDHEPRGWDR